MVRPVDRLVDAAGIVTLAMGGALTLWPATTARAVGLGERSAVARALGAADLALAPALLRKEGGRWRPMAVRAGLNAVIGAVYAAEATGSENRRAQVGATAMAVLTLVDGAAAIALRSDHDGRGATTPAAIVGEARATVRATPRQVFELVLDLDRYRLVDHKIGKVGEVRRTGDEGTVQFSGRLRGLPGPRGTYPFAVDGSRLTIGSPIAGAARWFLDFEATFDCTPTDDGTEVVHRETFRFKRPWRWVAAPALRRWLHADVVAEMDRLAAHIDHEEHQD